MEFSVSMVSTSKRVPLAGFVTFGRRCSVCYLAIGQQVSFLFSKIYSLWINPFESVSEIGVRWRPTLPRLRAWYLFFLFYALSLRRHFQPWCEQRLKKSPVRTAEKLVYEIYAIAESKLISLLSCCHLDGWGLNHTGRALGILVRCK